jgi:phosphatidylglycerol:prolipoprotein diacylglycerol transferase
MLPYVDPPVLGLGGAQVSAFSILVLLAGVTGFELVVRRAPRAGLARAEAARLAVWTLLLGFLGSHVFAELTTCPARVREDPRVLLWFWGSLSSLGGMLGGSLGACLAARARRLPGRSTLRFLDLVAFAAPFAWALGRLGCALVHDHPGVVSRHWLAVDFPSGPRLDLGLLELPLHLGLALAFLLLHRCTREGLFLGLFLAIYGPVRFALDFLRIGETRHLGLTPAQLLCAGASLLGLWLCLRARGGDDAGAVTSRP